MFRSDPDIIHSYITTLNVHVQTWSNYTGYFKWLSWLLGMFRSDQSILSSSYEAWLSMFWARYIIFLITNMLSRNQHCQVAAKCNLGSNLLLEAVFAVRPARILHHPHTLHSHRQQFYVFIPFISQMCFLMSKYGSKTICWVGKLRWDKVV